jgi:hypothetical protein
MNRAVAGAVILALAIVSFIHFPGHTWLQSDTQIYAPILEHLWDPTVLTKEMLVDRPHVSFTIYDELAIGLRRLTGLGFREVLLGEHFVFRALGICGVYLMASSLGLSLWPSLLVTGIFSLGAAVPGPTVLLFEYEPVPRGFAVPLLFLALGLLGHGRHFWAGCAASFAFLIHAPTTWPFWGIYFVLALWPGKPAIMRQHLHALVPLIAAALLLALASRLQAGVGETQAFFTRLDALHEKLQRTRAPYVYISIWAELYWKHFVAATAVALAAGLRILRHAPPDLRWFLMGLPAAGALSVPLSYLLLERMKWALTPQIQPMRALLFVVAFAIFAPAAAACLAAARKRWPEALGWLLVAVVIPVTTRFDIWPPANRAAVIAGLGIAGCIALWLQRRAMGVAVAAFLAAAFLALPGYGKIVNYPGLNTEQLLHLAGWARQATARDAVFLFPEAGRDLDPGIFRAHALRAVYVDWKGGGQVNYLKELGELWWQRWQAIAPYRPERIGEYQAMGIDYIVLTKSRLPVLPAFDNGKYRTYKIR